MAYTIKLLDRNAGAQYVISILCEYIERDGRFTCEFEQEGDRILLRKVRLMKAKPYCGQHPGPCQIGPFGERPRRNMRFLEWDDWVAFHSVVNDALDGPRRKRGRSPIRADIWTNPPEKLDKGKRMWVRRGLA